MSGNPKKSKWRSTSTADRKRKPLNLTLPEDAHEMLDQLAEGTSKSAVVEKLVREEHGKRRRQ